MLVLFIVFFNTIQYIECYAIFYYFCCSELHINCEVHSRAQHPSNTVKRLWRGNQLLLRLRYRLIVRTKLSHKMKKQTEKHFFHYSWVEIYLWNLCIMSSILIYSANDNKKVSHFCIQSLRSKIMSIALKPMFSCIESYFFVVNVHWVHWQ